MIASTALICMALTVYHESRGEMIPGQYAVAQVLLRRAGEPDRVCKEAFAPKQFSWANQAAKRVPGGWQVKLPADQVAWDRALQISHVVLNMPIADFTRGQATHFHVTGLRPEWRYSMTRTARMGRHVFYRA